MDESMIRLGNTMLALQQKMDTTSNNMSNSLTPGYKSQTAVTKSFHNILSTLSTENYDANRIREDRGQVQFEPGVFVDDVATDFSEGNTEYTGYWGDLALQGNGFFVVDNGGQDGYVASLKLEADSQGYLVDQNGLRVQGQNGDIFAGDYQLTVDTAGNITDASGKLLDKLQVVGFNDLGSLSQQGDGVFTNGLANNTATVDYSVHQGYQESSNVDVNKEMLKIISLSRSFETNSQVTGMIDTIIEKSVNQLGKVNY